MTATIIQLRNAADWNDEQAHRAYRDKDSRRGDRLRQQAAHLNFLADGPDLPLDQIPYVRKAGQAKVAARTELPTLARAA